MTKTDIRPEKRHADVRVAVAAVAGLGAGVIAALHGPWQAAELIGWVLAAVAYLADRGATRRREHRTCRSPRGSKHSGI